MAGDAVGVLFGAVAVRVHVVPHEVTQEREAIREPDHHLVQVIGVVGVDHRVDVTSDAHLRYVSQRGDQVVPGARVLGDEVVHLAAVAVDRDVNVAQPGVHGAAEEVAIRQSLTVGDHAAVETALAGVAQRRKQQRRGGRLAAGQDHAVVAELL